MAMTPSTLANIVQKSDSLQHHPISSILNLLCSTNNLTKRQKMATAPRPPINPQNYQNVFNSVPPGSTHTATSGTFISQSPFNPGGLHIAANQRENVALARQVVNHQEYLCYQLPRYYQCGHPVGTKDLLLSQRHVIRLGYGTACNSNCAVDHSRRTVDSKQCTWCVPVEECFSVVMKHSCGHLAGVLSSAGLTHNRRLGAQTPCNGWCRSLQVSQNVGGACEHCTWGSCSSKCTPETVHFHCIKCLVFECLVHDSSWPGRYKSHALRLS